MVSTKMSDLQPGDRVTSGAGRQTGSEGAEVTDVRSEPDGTVTVDFAEFEPRSSQYEETGYGAPPKVVQRWSYSAPGSATVTTA